MAHVDGVFLVGIPVSIDSKPTKVLVSCIYRKPASNTHTFCEEIELLFGIVQTNMTLFLCGDFNIDILKHDSLSGTKHFVDTMYSLNLYQQENQPL